MVALFNRNRALGTTLLVVAGLLGIVAATMEARVWVSILLSGLTLGALYFLVASGLSLIFGLMDVLNFAHGSIFMIGAYVGFTFFSQPERFFAWLPVVLALGSGLCLAPLGGALAGRWRLAHPAGRLGLLAAGLLLGWLVVGAVRGTGTFSLPALLGLAIATTLVGTGLIAGGGHRGAVRPGRPLAAAGALLGVALLLALAQGPIATWVAGSNTNLRFLLAMAAGAASGALLGAALEWGLIRPLYSRPLYQVLLTLGLVFVGDEFVKAVWGPTGFPMERPALFDGSCRADSVAQWLAENCGSINILGRAFATYRIFIIVLGLFLLISVGLLLKRSRLGMIIRAGVQDRQMVEALGINVGAVFTGVFAFGAALAALGGVAAAPFIGVSPTMGLEYQLQAFIVVVLGGMGSFPGAALGSALVGLARAFGDHFVLSGIALPGMAEATRLSPAIARASTVLVMAVFLLALPSGIFGKKE